MKKKDKSINKVLIWQTGAQFLIQGLSFFTAPFFTRLMTPADYGQLSTYGSWVSLTGLFIGLQTYGTIALAKLKFEGKEFDKYLSSIMTLSLLSFVVVFPISIILQKPLGTLIGFPTYIIPIIILHSFFSYCIGFFSTVLIQFKKVEKNAIISICQSALIILFSFLFVINMRENKYLGKIFAEILVIVSLGFLLLIIVYYKGKVFYNKEYWEFCLPLCLPLIFHGLGSVIFAQSDRIMLKAMIGENETGIYSIVYTLALVVNIIRNSCNTIWVPFYYEDKKNGNTELIKKRSFNYLILFTIITMGFILLAPEVFKILAPENYWSGLNLIPFVALSYYFNFIYTFPANYEFYHGKNRVIAVGTVVVAVLNIGLNYVLIPKLGSLGAAIATLISFILSFLIQDLNVRLILKTKNFEYNYRFYMMGIVPVCITSVLYYILADFWYIRWGLGAVLGVYLITRIIKRKSIF